MTGLLTSFKCNPPRHCALDTTLMTAAHAMSSECIGADLAPARLGAWCPRCHRPAAGIPLTCGGRAVTDLKRSSTGNYGKPPIGNQGML
jgi:hypothetical protein